MATPFLRARERKAAEGSSPVPLAFSPQTPTGPQAHLSLQTQTKHHKDGTIKKRKKPIQTRAIPGQLPGILLHSEMPGRLASLPAPCHACVLPLVALLSNNKRAGFCDQSDR